MSAVVLDKYFPEQEEGEIPSRMRRCDRGRKPSVKSTAPSGWEGDGR